MTISGAGPMGNNEHRQSYLEKEKEVVRERREGNHHSFNRSVSVTAHVVNNGHKTQISHFHN